MDHVRLQSEVARSDDRLTAASSRHGAWRGRYQSCYRSVRADPHQPPYGFSETPVFMRLARAGSVLWDPRAARKGR